MYLDTRPPQPDRRQPAWCPAASPMPLALSLPGAAADRPRNVATTYPATPDRAAAFPFEPELATSLPSENQTLRLIIEQAVALGFDIEPELLSFPSRGRARTALARQVGMYLAHVSLSFSLTQVGQLFDRDRTTVAHACEVVEQRRDDVTFDRAIELLERVVRIMCTAPSPSATTAPVFRAEVTR
jgi:Bacterial dnaA protein helix-turn-helix